MNKTVVVIFCYNVEENIHYILKTIKKTHLSNNRDFLFIDDVIDCIDNTINYKNDGFNIFNISSGIRYSMNTLISKIEKITNTKLNIKYNPEIPDEKCIWADNSKARKLLGFEPKFDIDYGLKSLINNIL